MDGEAVMPKLIILFLLVGLARPLFATEQVTVAELETTVAALHRKPDSTVSVQLSGLQLTERLSTPRLEKLKSELQGDEAREALTAMADASAFLDLPAADIPATPPPDRAAQDDMLARTRDFVLHAIPMLPNFFATQVTLQFSDVPKDPTSEKQMRDRRLHPVGSARATVRYIAGREETEPSKAEVKSSTPVSQQPVAEGVFALAYGVVLKDAFSGTPSWSHWEKGTAGPIAVFHYNVPIEKSHYNVPVIGEERLYMHLNAYAGEMAIDPATGAILRITFVAARPPTSSVNQANILIEYGPVEIGGKTYICPIRSVALSGFRDLDLAHDIYKFSEPVHSPYFLRVNDVAYGEYHMFQTEMHMLPAQGSGSSGETTPAPNVKPNSAPQPSPQR